MIESGFRKKDLKKKIIDILHICQCGKEFLSFPAIYSHAKTKHNFKISSKLDEKNRKFVQNNSQTKIFYQIHDSDFLVDCSNSDEEKKQINPVEQNKLSSMRFKLINKIKSLETSNGNANIYSTVIEFLKYCSDKYSLETINLLTLILNSLTQCINEHYMHFDPKKVETDYCSEHQAHQLPIYFNFFLIWYIPTKSKDAEIDKDKCEILLKVLFKWLKEKRLTQLQIQSYESINEEQFLKNPNSQKKEEGVHSPQKQGFFV